MIDIYVLADSPLAIHSFLKYLEWRYDDDIVSVIIVNNRSSNTIEVSIELNNSNTYKFLESLYNHLCLDEVYMRCRENKDIWAFDRFNIRHYEA